MITLERVTIENIRSIGAATFQPLTDGGLTALNGANGAGKSTVLTALLWALYGETPEGVQVQALRRQGSTGPVKVVVTFRHDGQVIEVERGLKGAKDVPYVTITVDGVLQTYGKIRAANAWTQARFNGLDADGFLAAFVTRQKELDGLIKAKPAARRALFERLAGIDRMSAAVKSAREEEAHARRTLEFLPGSAEDLAAARESLDVAQQRAVSTWETFEAAQHVTAAAQQTAQAAEAGFQAMSTRIAAHRSATDALRSAEHDATLANERASAAQRDLARISAAADGGTPQALAAARDAHAQAQREAQADRDALVGAQRAAADEAREVAQARAASERASRLHVQADTLATSAAQAAQASAALPAAEDLSRQADAAQIEAQGHADERGARRGEYERLTKALGTLSAAHEPTCPTCQTHLEDPAALIASLVSARDLVASLGGQSRDSQEQAEQRAAALRGALAQASAAAQEARHAAEAAAQAVLAANDADAEAADAQARASAAARLAEQARTSAALASTRADSVEVAVSATASALRRAESAAEAAAQVPSAQAALAAATASAAAAQDLVRQAAQAEQSARVPDSEQVAVLAAQSQASERLQQAVRAEADARADHREAEVQVRVAEQARDSEEAKVRARGEAVADLEIRTAVREGLDAFRKDRIARLAPEVSEVATDLVSRMTNGRFVAVELDEEFTAVVTDDRGRQRPAAWLSGGEESAVALALRVALGELFAGQRGGLLWLDEPFTAQDSARRHGMMSVLGDLPGRQVIIVSHASEATDMVDLVCDVVPDDEHGSTITVASDHGALTEVALVDIDAPAEPQAPARG